MDAWWEYRSLPQKILLGIGLIALFGSGGAAGHSPPAASGAHRSGPTVLRAGVWYRSLRGSS